MWDIGKASRRPRRFASATEGGVPRFSGSVARGSRCPAPPRHALLAENLGKPSLWIIINEIWYYGSQSTVKLSVPSSAKRAARVWPRPIGVGMVSEPVDR